MSTNDLCPETIPAALARAATVGPDLEAVVAPGARLTYGKLAEAAALHRSALASLGVTTGTRVALCVGNGPAWVVLFHAITSIGAVAVPINTRLKPSEISYVLGQSRSEIVIVAPHVATADLLATFREVFPALGTESPALPLEPSLPSLREVVVTAGDVPSGASSLSDLVRSDHAVVEPTARPDDVALIQYTSGTTSAPKGVLLTHRSLCLNAFHSGLRVGLRAGDRLFSCRPFFHVAGTTLSILSCTQHVSTLVTNERFEAGSALATMASERCTHFSGNDTIALMLLEHPALARTSLHLRGAWVAGAPSVLRRVVDELGAVEAVVGYGLSEASPNVAQSAWWEDDAVRVAGRMLPQPGVEVRVVSSAGSGDALPPDAVGEILVRGWNVMRGYLDMPDETAAALSSDGWLSTGDLGSIGADGRLTFRGRLKDILRVGGENVSPAEVEDALRRHPDVREAVVVGLPDPRLVEVPHAIVTLRPDAQVSAGDVAAWARTEMAGFKAPRQVHVVSDLSELGMTESSKVRRDDARRWVMRRLEDAS